MKQSDMDMLLDSIGKRAVDRIESDNDAVAQFRAASTHPMVAADLAAARLHGQMFRLHDRLTDMTPKMPTDMGYQPNTVRLTRLSRLVAMRHVIGEHRIFVGWSDGKPDVTVQTYIEPLQWPDIDDVIVLMAKYLMGETDAVIPTLSAPSPNR